ncbi:hypothetical protein [Endozoicomonas sp. ONNA2]|uniref:hypothetical protein n=1 Tax=Endozoicomonas sp. ONNA2 TaxID=2828741 RepID=UPI002148C695|nr:hypothetical protein [Endozoicomonas sp. ONNA2]
MISRATLNPPMKQPPSDLENPKTTKTEVTVPQCKDEAVLRTHTTPISLRAVCHSEKTSALEASDTFKPKTSSQKQTALDNMESPFKADDITISDPEFNQPPGKIKKLALAIKIFSKSFKTIYQVNHPETDRSSLVERIRSKVYTVTSVLLNILNFLQFNAVGAGLCVGGLFLLSTVSMGAASAALCIPAIVFASLIIGVGAFYLGNFLVVKASDFITSTASAMVDTREKLTEATTLTLPKDRFLNKYQRMEESLITLRTKFYAAEYAKVNHNIKLFKAFDKTEELKIAEQKHEDLEEARKNDNIPYPDPKWFDSLQYFFLREEYGCNLEKLKEAIDKTQDWLDRAAKQKELLTQERQKQEELVDKDTQPIGGSSEVDRELWIAV